MSVVGALLAAGAGTRFEGPTHKLLAPLRGRRVVDWAHEHAVDSGLELLVVTGAVADLGLPNQRHNDRWADGMGHTARPRNVSTLLAALREVLDH